MLIGGILNVLFGWLLSLSAVFIILLVLVQRGRGGGLAGALGGMGGQSAFGAKAGDTFTRITVIAATVWILLCIASIILLTAPEDDLFQANQPGGSVPSRSVPGAAATDGGATDGGATDGGATDGGATDGGPAGDTNGNAESAAPTAGDSAPSGEEP